MMDFVHLYDVSFIWMTCSSCSSLHAAAPGSQKILQIETIAWECSEPAGVQICGPRYKMDPIGNQEKYMNNFAIRLSTLAMYTMALIAVPLTTAYAAGGDNPAPPASDTKKEKKKKDKSSSIDDPKFLEGYRAAYATIYDRNDYTSAIGQLKALGQDDRADVANLIGYSYRKLGDYKVSQIWYERALKADPNHVKTWQYYGLWQVEQGNRDQAQYHLNRIAALSGTSSEEYRSLAAALEKSPGTGLVY
jgi:tetratricopeptide (TPR) repeat protein